MNKINYEKRNFVENKFRKQTQKFYNNKLRKFYKNKYENFIKINKKVLWVK